MRSARVSNLKNAAPQLVSSASSPGLWQSLASIIGNDSIKDGNEKQRWTALYACEVSWCVQGRYTDCAWVITLPS